MQLKDGRITFLFDDEGATLEIQDNEANVQFLKIRLNQEQVCQMLSRLGTTYCELTEVFHLDKVGKKHINKTFEFELPDCDFMERKQCAIETIKDVCPKDWESDNYFNSQNSFFNKDGKQYARVTIRKWE